MSDVLLKNSELKEHAVEWLCSSDQLRALREIITGTPTSGTASRDLLVSHCIYLMSSLNNNQAPMDLVADVPGLGADLMTSISTTAKNHGPDADYASAQNVSENEESEGEESEGQVSKKVKLEDAELEHV